MSSIHQPIRCRASTASAKHKPTAPAYNPPVTNKIPNLACPSCTYELEGLPLSNGTTTCPECGSTVHPIPADRFFTKKQLHKHLAINLLTPTAAPLLFILIGMHIYNPIALGGCLMTVIFPVLTLCFGFYQLSTVLILNEKSPKKTSQALLALWILLYLVPGVFLYFLIMSFFLPQVA